MKPETQNVLLKVGLAVLSALLLVAVIYGAGVKYKHEKQIETMANAIAERDKTIEVQKSVYDRLSIQNRDLEKMLVGQGEDIVNLKKQLDKTKSEILTVNQLVIKWKKAYDDLLDATQHPDPTDPTREVVEFGPKSLGPVIVKGHTKTNPPEARISLEQARPLALTLVVSQDKDKLWHSTVTTDEDDFSVEIKNASVNPWILEPKWYEGVAISTVVAIGKGTNVTGLLGVGVTVPIKQFNVGPMAFAHVGSEVDVGIGLSFAWRPFQ